MRKCKNDCNDFPELKNKELGNMALLQQNKSLQSRKNRKTIFRKCKYMQKIQFRNLKTCASETTFLQLMDQSYFRSRSDPLQRGVGGNLSAKWPQWNNGGVRRWSSVLWLRLIIFTAAFIYVACLNVSCKCNLACINKKKSDEGNGQGD